MTDYAEIARLGVATMHEAAGRVGIVDLDLTQVVPGSRVAGPARRRIGPPERDELHLDAQPCQVEHELTGQVLVPRGAVDGPLDAH